MRLGRWPVVAAIGLLLPAAVAAQSHEGHGAEAAAPLLRLALEGPHLTLAHQGYLVLTATQVDDLIAARGRLCAREAEYVRERSAAAVAALAASDRSDADASRAAIERLTRAERDWIAALIAARRDTRRILGSAERAQLATLASHWAAEAGLMLTEATAPGHRGHPGRQVPIRVPGMVVGETAIVPYCEALHGPAVHLSVPPPG